MKSDKIEKGKDGRHRFQGLDAKQWDELSGFTCDPAHYDMADHLNKLDREGQALGDIERRHKGITRGHTRRR